MIFREMPGFFKEAVSGIILCTGAKAQRHKGTKKAVHRSRFTVYTSGMYDSGHRIICNVINK